MAQNAGLVAVTPSDTTVFNPPLKRLWVGAVGDGAITLVDVFGNTVKLLVPPLNEWILFQMSPIAQVKATGTGVTNVVGDTNPNQ